MEIQQKENPQEFQIIKDDPYLSDFKNCYIKLHSKMNEKLQQFKGENGLEEVSQSYKKFGIHRVYNTQSHAKYVYLYHEWAPGAQQISIFGDFNNWNRQEYKCKKNQYGHWDCLIERQQQIKQYSKIKCQVRLSNGQVQDRIPAWINFTIQNQDKTFDGMYIQLEKNYKFQYPKPKWQNKNLKVYQTHIGMCGIYAKVHSFTDFKNTIIPKVLQLGYNVIQIMGVMEHPYYGSFGYHVSNFFSVSSRFGKPTAFKEMIDQAHKHGIKVIVDIVHSHAAKNALQGINMWDGTDYQYFHGGDKGIHPLWDSRIFDYSKYQVLRFLLSNVRFWIEQYNVDGFRFDGVTSMIYTHHGAGYGFTGNYKQYFNEYLDYDSLVYLMLANSLIKKLYPQAILIAEDVSGFPALCRSVEQGGIGFNYRLTMAIPDMWIKLLKQTKDQDWNIEKIVYQLSNKRWKQKCITYVESHDQALVGDKTISMWLFDEQVYTNMSIFNQETLKVFRGMALHKMIRLLTFSLGGQGYLTFMGNEFGHPQWIDFPRQGNNWSYHYCRRNWNLVNDDSLRYKYLNEFQKQMIGLDKQYNILQAQHEYIRNKHNDKKTITFEKNNIAFIFNFHCTNSYNDQQVYVRKGKWGNVLFSTDDLKFGGHGRVAHDYKYKLQQVDEFCSKFKVYLPSRCAIVLKIEQ